MSTASGFGVNSARIPSGIDSKTRDPVVSEPVDTREGLLDEIERITAGIPTGLLSLHPYEVRALARKAIEAEERAERRRRRVGARPALDAATDLRLADLLARAADAERVRDRLSGRRHWWLAAANGGALGALAMAGALLELGLPAFSMPVALQVFGAGAAPVTVAVVGARRVATARRTATAARAALAAALQEAGIATLGELAARRVQLAHWQRRAAEAEAATQAAALAYEGWLRAAGPRVPPSAANGFVVQMRFLRNAQLRLLRLSLSRTLSREPR